MTTCKNCTHHFEGNFCNFCGQPSHTHEINLHYIVHEIQHGIFHVDKGFFFNIKQLFTRPGNAVREYIEGKRISYFKPFAFLLIISTIYAFLSHALNDNPVLENWLMGLKDGSRSKSFVALEWLITHYAYTSLLIIPITALASYLAFIKSGYNYFQHLILNVFVSGQTTVFYIVYSFITYLINKNNDSYALDIIEISIGVSLTFWTYFQFFNNIKTIPKILLTTLSYILSTLFVLTNVVILFLIAKLLA